MCEPPLREVLDGRLRSERALEFCQQFFRQLISCALGGLPILELMNGPEPRHQFPETLTGQSNPINSTPRCTRNPHAEDTPFTNEPNQALLILRRDRLSVQQDTVALWAKRVIGAVRIVGAVLDWKKDPSQG